jgi:hypothetical protein
MNRLITVRTTDKDKSLLSAPPRSNAISIIRTSEHKLIFGEGNAKLTNVHTFSLPAGYACPHAKECLSKADRDTGRITDGKNTRYRCFSASAEALFPSVRRARWYNLEALHGMSRKAMADLILASLPAKAHTVRIHVAGDFYNQSYFDAWLAVAIARPDVHFYAYTKSLPYWVARLGKIPDNFVLTASKGGKHDDLIPRYGLRQAVVVFSEFEAGLLGLPLDHDDTLAMHQVGDFALLLHGPQPKGSDAARSISELRRQGMWGYGQKADQRRRVSLATV